MPQLIRDRACIRYTATTQGVLLNLVDGTWHPKRDDTECHIVTCTLKRLLSSLEGLEGVDAVKVAELTGANNSYVSDAKRIVQSHKPHET